jgi:hypothetical protein
MIEGLIIKLRIQNALLYQLNNKNLGEENLGKDFLVEVASKSYEMLQEVAPRVLDGTEPFYKNEHVELLNEVSNLHEQLVIFYDVYRINGEDLTKPYVEILEAFQKL